MSVQTKLCLDRSTLLWRGVSPETVGSFLKELRQFRKRFRDERFLFAAAVGLSERRCDDLLSLLDEEIGIGEFYFELRKKQGDPAFDQWVFQEQEQRRDAWPWIAGDAWLRSNGRVKVAVVVDQSRVSARVSLHVANDSEHLVFFSPERGKEVCHRYLRDEAGIHVTRLRERADAILEEHRFPAFLVREHNVVRALLHLGVHRGGDG
jgi:hypothetical protein